MQPFKSISRGMEHSLLCGKWAGLRGFWKEWLTAYWNSKMTMCIDVLYNCNVFVPFRTHMSKRTLHDPYLCNVNWKMQPLGSPLEAGEKSRRGQSMPFLVQICLSWLGRKIESWWYGFMFYFTSLIQPGRLTIGASACSQIINMVPVLNKTTLGC